MAIPRILHLIYFYDGESRPIPVDLSKKICLYKRRNPDWEIKIYAHEDMIDFISRHYSPDIISLFLKIRLGYGAAKADFFRYLLMAERGGVYLDSKFDFSLPLDDMIKDESYLLTHWDNRRGEAHEGWGLHRELSSIRGEYVQGIIVTKPQSPILKQVLKNVIFNILHYSLIKDGVGQMAVLKVTGPIAYSLAVERSLHTEKIRKYDSICEIGLSYPKGFDIIERQRISLFGYNYKASWKPLLTVGPILDPFYIIFAFFLRVWRRYSNKF